MVSPFHDFPVLQHQNGVGVADRGQTVSDHQGGTVGHQPVHALLDVFFRPGIHGRGRLVQNQDGGPGNGRPCDIEKLPLPLAQIGAVPFYHGIIPFFQTHDEGMRAGGFRRLLHLLIRGVQPAVADVLPDRACEKVGILQHHGDIPAQTVPPDIPDVHVVNGDFSPVNIIKAVDQVGDGGLARTGGADEGDLLARFCIQAHML